MSCKSVPDSWASTSCAISGWQLLNSVENVNFVWLMCVHWCLWVDHVWERVMKLIPWYCKQSVVLCIDEFIKFICYQNNFVKLDSLEQRRLRFDVMFTYTVLFGLVDMNYSDIFAFIVLALTRGHLYKLYIKTSHINTRHNIFCNRVVNIWNRLPASDFHF